MKVRKEITITLDDVHPADEYRYAVSYDLLKRALMIVDDHIRPEHQVVMTLRGVTLWAQWEEDL